jgi:hypothetical protein
MKTPPKMTFEQQQARIAAKRLSICRFLAGGEVYSTSAILADLLGGVSRQTCERTLQGMERDKLVVHERLAGAGPLVPTLWGITPHGLAFADACGDPHHELGRTNASYVQHRLDRQKIRIAAESAGWTAWTTERALHIAAEAAKEKLRKIPDAVATSPDGKRIAIEIERHAKTPKRYAELITAYILEIKAGRYSSVHFICPPGIAHLVERAMNKVEFIKFQGEAVKVEPAHRARFRYFSFNDWTNAQTAIKEAA